MSAGFTVGMLTIDTVSWTPILALADCDSVILGNGSAGDIKIRTNSTDATTQKIIPRGGGQQIMIGTARSGPGVAFRFPNGSTIAFAQAVSGTGPLLIDCLE